MVLVATQVKRRRGTTAENDAFTGAEGEITVDTEKHELRVHDGMTQGGFKVGGGGSGRNVGDIFTTLRSDNELNGAVECDGSEYDTGDYTGSGSIGELLANGKLPYVSLTDYATAIATKGWCDKFGWNGTGTTAFKVPTLNAYIWQKLNMAVVGNGNNTVYTDGTNDCVFNPYFGSSNNGIFVDKNASHINVANGTNIGTATNISEHHAIGLSTDKTKSNVLTDTTDDICDERVMVQLFIATTDEAVATCTEVLSDVAGLKTLTEGMIDYVVESQEPTADNGHTWYRKYKSGWVEQGQARYNLARNTTTAITLPVEMASTEYTGQISGANTTFSTPSTLAIAPKSTTQVNIWNYNGTASMGINWQVSGMSAQ